MEEPKAAQNPPPVQDPNPPPATATAAEATPPPPQQLPPTAAPEQPPSKKRLSENSIDQLKQSEYYKMRLIVKDLRPHFIEVLQTPDFRNCKAAEEIREKMKLLMELYSQISAETVSTEKCNNAPGETGMKQKPEEQPQVVKPAATSDNKTFQSGNVADKRQLEDGEAAGTYIVGGSAFGWNFITFGGSKPVYYGVTKELFRSAQATVGEE